jgi:hypothetical protein
MTVPVHGQLERSDEVFAGTATGYLDGGGVLKVTSSKGAVCTGDSVYVNGRQGSGVLTCSDGRTGTYDFVSTGSHGNGYGALDGHRFTFTFGG